MSKKKEMATKTITIKPNSRTGKWEVWHPDRIEDRETGMIPKVGLCFYDSETISAQDSFEDLKLKMIGLHNQEILRLSKSAKELIKLELPNS